MNTPDPSTSDSGRLDVRPAPVAAAPANQLDTLGVLYYVLAALTGLFSLIPIIHVVMGLAMIGGRFEQGPNPPPPMVGWIFVIMGAMFILGGLACAALFAMTGQRLRQRRGYTFCLVVSAISCTLMPFGTILGVFALIELTKPHIKALFAPAR
ncbi:MULTISPECIES: hypothetical protein [unclassified Lysobacter]|uniref:hypothetical protein n=1 Tax=unclassified Lysobacter TaxID=2635362 RepID=UPI001BEA5386|nr:MULTISPECIES: hypothetical protein [unclassified Lysobacter]MBT2749341.1 hypothetical protein [Lysobacter sp. ISL-42]MBT2750884.1 hypothetical protein [Lysobacter sp. ISL-50]MBT2777951.1 hypothetical protein [Lysobacter sp. ISL-54]MBT2783991.1 hypothetical protein [Lysobacter sp. ISL-52]